MIRAYLCTVLMLACSSVAGADIYVSTTGNDTTGTGSQAAPYATMSRAHQAAVGGDTIIFRSGIYSGDVYITRDNLTFQSFPGEWAVIQEPTTVVGQDNAFYIGTAANCVVRNLELQGGYFYAIKIDTGPCLVEDCIIHGSGRDCVKIPGADDVTIRRCEIYDSGQRDPSNAEGIDNVNGDNMLVQDCYIHDIATNGLYPKGGSIGSVIERNLIRNCGEKGISMAQASGTQFYDTAQNPEYYSCRDCIARNNIIENCEGSGIDLEAAYRAQVYNNTMINVAKSQNGGIRFASKTLAGVGTVQCTGCFVVNNIIVIEAASARPMLFMGANAYTGALFMDNNRYYKVGGPAVYWWEPTGSYNLDLAGWQTASAVDASSTEGDPLVNATTWHLDTGSPCIDTGATGNFSDDYDGNTRSGMWDIGADETGGTPLTTPPASGTVGTGGGASTPGAPIGPTNLQSTFNGNIGLSWFDNSNNESGFRIERNKDDAGFQSLDTVGANVTSYTDTDICAGKYEYRVVAFNAAGDSGPSNTTLLVILGPGGVECAERHGNPDNDDGSCTSSTQSAGWLAILCMLAVTAYTRRRV